MTGYHVRIELHDAPPLAYSELHTGMSQIGGLMIVQSATGDYFRLPNASYHFANSSLTAKEIAELVFKLALTITPPPAKTPWVLVAKSSECWFYLPEVKVSQSSLAVTEIQSQ